MKLRAKADKSCLFYFFFIFILLHVIFLCVNMASTKRGNKKQPTDASEEDFEAFVRESLARLCEGQEKIIQDISKLKAKVQLNEGALD